MANCLFTCLYYLQFHRVIRYLNRKKIVILTYHGFIDEEADIGNNNIRTLYLDVRKFKSQMECLKKYYNVISLDRLIEHYTNGTELPLNSVVITIDDGYKSSYTLAYPILKEFDVPATIFLTTDFIDNKEMLWLDRIEYAINMTEFTSFNLKIDGGVLSFDCHDSDSKKACYVEICTKLKAMPQEAVKDVVEGLERLLGQKLSIDKDNIEVYRPLEWHEILEMIKTRIISIGSHTSSHVILTQCSPENMGRELLLSKQLIEQKTRSDCRLFAYPNGEAGDFDNRTKKLLAKFGYSCGLTAVAGMNDEHSDVFELRRSHISSNVDLILFTMILSGVFKFFVDVKQSISNFLIGRSKY